MRYGGNEMEAEEILQTGFIQLFCHLHQFRFEGSLEGWVLRIFVNTAVNYYRKNLKYSREIELSDDFGEESMQGDVLSAISVKEMLSIIQSLPAGYRTVFNLYAMEEYKHAEIAEMLGISEGTSKSQLKRAKIMVRRMLKEIEK